MKPAPERIARAASRRIAAAASSRSDVTRALRAKRPLDAEDNIDRKLDYIQARVGVRRDTAIRIANYEDPNQLPLTADQKSRAEKVQGTTVDFLPISFFAVARAASRSVARVAFRNGNPQGTGFMVSPRLFLTNQHVINDANHARSFVLEFENELDARKVKRPITRFNIDATFFIADPEDDLDFALMAVGAKIDGPRELADFGFLPLFDTPDKHIKGAFVNVIQHPEGRPKETVVRENHIVERTANTLIYGSDTLPGSSGSPVFNDDWEVIALHHWGVPFRARVDNATLAPTLAGNEGIRISSIVKHLRSELPTLTTARAALLQQALNPPFRHPSLVAAFTGNEDIDRTDRIARTPAGVEPAASIASDGTLSMTFPLHFALRLGGPPTAAAAPSPIAAALLEPLPDVVSEPVDTESAEAIFKPDPEYSNRRGYNRRFLGQVVELPTLAPELRSVAATNRRARQNDDPFEFKYEHFSVVMNGERRLPFFTAGNVDGASVVRINRDTGKVTVEATEEESAEGYEKWYDDPRIDAAAVTQQDLYDTDIFRAIFHRGHLVKRTDPSWGSVDAAWRGQSDTFHFTNCAPQHKGFNPNRSRWAGVEDWISKGSDDADLRVTVFTGPVFRPDDPLFADFPVPREYWKVVVRVDDGQLLATAILADQSDLLAESEAIAGGRDAEDLPPFPDRLPAEYQVAVAEIEELTGLDFGPLRDYDTFAGDAEGARGRRRIERFEDISIQPPSSPRPPRERRRPNR